MKKIIPLFLLLMIALIQINATQHIISTGNFVFEPANITISAGDTVIFDLGASHNAVEVSEEVYNDNGNTSNGGFEVPFGGGTVVLNQSGTHYYVCVPHAAGGMKGTITVTSGTTALDEDSNTNIQIELMPNPASAYFDVVIQSDEIASYSILISDLKGSVLKYDTFSSIPNIRITIDETWSPGLYLVSIHSGNAILQKKLLIQ